MKSLGRLLQLGLACYPRICNPNRIRTPIYPCKYPYSSFISPSSSTVSHPYRFYSSTSTNGCSEALNTSLPRLETKEYTTESGFTFDIFDLPGESGKILLRRECSGDTIQVLAAESEFTISIIKNDGRCMELCCRIFGTDYQIVSVLMKKSKADESLSSLEDYQHDKTPEFRPYLNYRDYWLGSLQSYDRSSYTFRTWHRCRTWDTHLYKYLEARGVDDSMITLLQNYKRRKNYLNLKNVNEFVENNDVSIQANITSTNNLKDAAANLKIASSNEIKHLKSGGENYRLVKSDPNYVCPFEIVDKPGTNTATFMRELDGESILVEAGIIEYKDNPITVMITKKDGTRLKYCVDEYYGDFDEYGSIWIERPEGWCEVVRYTEDDDSEFTESVFRSLERAEINESFLYFLHNYIIKRLRREYIRLMRKVKRFV